MTRSALSASSLTFLVVLTGVYVRTYVIDLCCLRWDVFCRVHTLDVPGYMYPGIPGLSMTNFTRFGTRVSHVFPAKRTLGSVHAYVVNSCPGISVWVYPGYLPKCDQLYHVWYAGIPGCIPYPTHPWDRTCVRSQLVRLAVRRVQGCILWVTYPGCTRVCTRV